ncbi:MAG: oligosaccharide flippase family protein [Hymenobacter sp.]
MGALVSALGFTNTTLRYFPYFRNREAGHSGFLPLLLGVPPLVFCRVVLAAVAGPAAGAALVPARCRRCWARTTARCWALAFCILLYNLLEAYTKSLFHTAFSSFLTDVLQRLLIVGSALLYGAGFWSFDAFVLAYLGCYALIATLLLGYLAVIGELHLRPTRAVLRVRPVGELLRFGGYALLGNISGTLLVTIDSLMLGSHSFADAGIYNIALNISTALAVPFRALYKTAYPLIAEYWKDGATAQMLAFYQRTTRLTTALGAYLALGIGLEFAVYLRPHSPARIRGGERGGAAAAGRPAHRWHHGGKRDYRGHEPALPLRPALQRGAGGEHHYPQCLAHSPHGPHRGGPFQRHRPGGPQPSADLVCVAQLRLAAV